MRLSEDKVLPEDLETCFQIDDRDDFGNNYDIEYQITPPMIYDFIIFFKFF